MDNMNVIIKPLITEKSTHQQNTRNSYTFQVHPEANKDQIKNAVEKLYEVKVVDVGASRRVFPEDGTTEDGFPVNATTREVDNELYKSSSGRRKIEDSLADVLADKVAKTFYKHETKELGAPLGVR